MLGNNHAVMNTTITVSSATGLLYLSQYQGDNTVLDIASTYYVGYIIDFVTSDTYGLPIILYMSVCVILFLIGTYLPDIDSPTSTLGRYMPWHPEKHRVWTHNIWVVSFLFVTSILFRPFVWLFWCYTLHLVVDSFSYAGVCWFYPFSKYRHYNNGAFVKKNHKLKLYREGSPAEYVIVALSCVLCIFIVYNGVKHGVYNNLISYLL